MSSKPDSKGAERAGLNIIAQGSAVPENHATSHEGLYVACNVMLAPSRVHRRIRALHKGAGIEKRHSVVIRPREEWVDGNPAYEMFYTPSSEQDKGPSTADRMQAYEKHAPALALTAARRALAAADMPADSFTHLITVTCSGFSAPGVDIRLIKSLGLPATIERTQVGFMGCQGAMNGLRVAHGLAAARPDAKILMVAVELCSLHYYYGWETSEILANALFADGASAVVATSAAADVKDADPAPDAGPAPDPGNESKAGPTWRLTASGSCLVPDSEEAMSWHIRDNGFVMGLDPSVPKLIERNLHDWLADWLSGQGRSIEDIQSWAVHPGGPSVLNSVQRSLALPQHTLKESWGILSEYGNMSSPTILFIIERLRMAGAKLPCVAMAFGPGLTVEAALIEE